MGDRQGWGRERASRKGLPCTCREAEAAWAAGGVLVGAVHRAGGVEVGLVCRARAARATQGLLNRGVFTVYKAHSRWGEKVIIVKGKEAGRPVRRLLRDLDWRCRGPELGQWY